MTNDEARMTKERRTQNHGSETTNAVSHSSLGLGHSGAEWPPVTCLCPTYGRFAKLRESLACFLAQDYPGPKHLLILSDAAMPLHLGGNFAHRHAGNDTVGGRSMDYEVCFDVSVVNTSGFSDLGEKRQWLLELAAERFQLAIGNRQSAILAAHWDDDDLYLPWHLTDLIRPLVGARHASPDWRGPGLRSPKGGVGCTKVRASWEMVGGRIIGRHASGNDGSLVFDRQMALSLGGYPPKQTGQGIALLHAFEGAGAYAPVEQGELLSVVVRRDEGHNLAARTADEFRARNTDFGSGEPLTPADLRPLRDSLCSWAHQNMDGKSAYGRFFRALDAWIEPRHEEAHHD